MIEENITKFISEMVKLGYVEGEANALVHDFLGDKNIDILTKAEQEDLSEQMEGYLSFAKKCKQTIM
jgi:DNA topoisomerase IA